MSILARSSHYPKPAISIYSLAFDDIVIPAAVLGEIAKPGDMRPGSGVQDRTWMETRGVSMAARLELQKSRDIAAGEAEAILITAEAPESAVLLIDERRARRVAIERGLHTLRTGALLVAVGAACCNPGTSARRSRFFRTSGTWTPALCKTSSASCSRSASSSRGGRLVDGREKPRGSARSHESRNPAEKRTHEDARSPQLPGSISVGETGETMRQL